MTNYYHADHLSVRVATDATGSVVGQQGHYPFGESWYATSTTTKWQFTTYERDAESGNDYAMARYHVNRLGRFSSPDPYGGAASTPQSLNRYAYTANDPINTTDPSGQVQTPWGFAFGGVDFGSNFNEFDLLFIQVGTANLYHSDSRYFHFEDFSSEELARFAAQGEIQLMSSTPIYQGILLGAYGGGGGDPAGSNRSGGKPQAKKNPAVQRQIEKAWQDYQNCVKSRNEQVSPLLSPEPSRDTLMREAQKDQLKLIRPNFPSLPNGGNMPVPPGKGADGDIGQTILDIYSDQRRNQIKEDCFRQYPLAALSPNWVGVVPGVGQ